ncbi:MAG: hypothetical protein GF311_28300 [Candidatus Lokiarchaeota archaeon]|nr:hypothetical protein [Candidatus Lokiarchaeota archaeon]
MFKGGFCMGGLKFKVIILDGNNLFYRLKAVHDKEKGSAKTIFEVYLQYLNDFEKVYLEEGGKFYILFDNPVSKSRFRKEIDPEYKSNRLSESKQFYRELDFLQALILYYKDNWFLSYKHDFEADDIVFYILKYFEKDSYTLLVSEDFDWSRLITDKIILYKNKDFYTKEKFNKDFGFTPSIERVVRYKTIRGDKSDGIVPGLPNLPKQALINFVKDKRPLDYIIKNIENIDYFNSDWKAKFLHAKAKIKLNYALVNFIPLSRREVYDCVFSCKFRKKALNSLLKCSNIKLDFDGRLIESKSNLFNGFQKER